MVFIPGGEYLRGRSDDLPDAKLEWYPNPLKDDQPVRKIHVDPFYLDETEVTVEAYAAFHRPPPTWPGGKPPKDKLKTPVVDVSWTDAVAYCASKGKRLPTEAEWERAARGLADGRKYPWGDREPTSKDARFDSLDGPVDVCKYPKNGFGLCDIAGNAWEWTADWYARDYYAAAPDRNPKGPDAGMYRVLRGGSWFDVAKFLSNANRSWARPHERSPNIGFRCAKDFK